jgi:soluble cytochrome b562
MHNVFSFDPDAKANRERKDQLLEVLEEIKRQVEEGEIKELAACSLE